MLLRKLIGGNELIAFSFFRNEDLPPMMTPSTVLILDIMFQDRGKLQWSLTGEDEQKVSHRERTASAKMGRRLGLYVEWCWI